MAARVCVPAGTLRVAESDAAYVSVFCTTPSTLNATVPDGVAVAFPVVMVDDQLHEKVDRAKACDLAVKIKAEAAKRK